MSENKPSGLSSANRGFIVYAIAFGLLLYGPIEPYGLIVRIAYVVGIPTIIWFLLNQFSDIFNISERTNDWINRSLYGLLAVTLLIWSYQSWTSQFHSVCDQYVQTRDGRECVGDYVTVKGPDKVMAAVLAIVAGIIIWYAVLRRTPPHED